MQFQSKNNDLKLLKIIFNKYYFFKKIKFQKRNIY